MITLNLFAMVLHTCRG